MPRSSPALASNSAFTMHVYKYISILTIVLLAVPLSCTLPSSFAAQQTAQPKPRPDSSPAFKPFLDRVRAYSNVHKAAATGLPGGKPTDLPEVITARQIALARKIREARRDAKRGDLFFDDSAKAFRTVIASQFAGSQGQKVRTTIRQGSPLPDLHLKVNETYPAGMAFTTVPPALLLKLPKLPDTLSYCIVGPDFVLLDVEANLVVDFIPDVIPKSLEAQ